MIDRIIESKSGDFYKIMDSIVEAGTSKYVCVNLKTRLIELVQPIYIVKFVDISQYILLNSKFIFDTDDNIIKELRNKINFKTYFSINNNAKTSDILITEVIIDEYISDILKTHFKTYITDEICNVKKLVSTIRVRNKIDTFI